MSMTADDELLSSRLSMLGDGELDDAELERRVIKFQGALQRLRDDAAEATRIDVLIADAEDADSGLQTAGAHRQAAVLTALVPRRFRSHLDRRSRAAAAEFFERHYLKLLAFSMYMGATREEAEDAVESVMIGMLDRWKKIGNPLAYARRAVAREVLRQRTRSQPLGRRDRGAAQEERPTVWEDTQWVRGLLNSLPPRQQEVMALIMDEFSPAEMAVMLGRDPAAIRQSLKAAWRGWRTAASAQRKQAAKRGPDEVYGRGHHVRSR